MRESLANVLISLFAVPIQAQQPPQQPAQQQEVMQVEYRDMATSGNYIAANETLINGKVCRPAGSPLQVVDPNSKPEAGSTARTIVNSPYKWQRLWQLRSKGVSFQRTPLRTKNGRKSSIGCKDGSTFLRTIAPYQQVTNSDASFRGSSFSVTVPPSI